jgi:IMP dehydrogenase/GMP reductase
VCYTYDDVIFHPGHIDFAADAVDLSTKLTRNITIRTPIVSSPMDTVTEADMAIAMASVGGAGFLHYNMTEDEQLANLKAVKAHRLGYVTRPEVVARRRRSRSWTSSRRDAGSRASPSPPRAPSAARYSACAPAATTSWCRTGPRRCRPS